MEPELSIQDRYVPRSDVEFLRRVVRETLAFAERPALEVALLLTDDAEIADFHGRFLDDPTPTDVITFPREDGNGVDLVVSVERAHAIAADTGHAPQNELALYVVHGLLHACGFDDLDAAARREMRAAERVVLDRLGLEVATVDRDEEVHGVDKSSLDT